MNRFGDFDLAAVLSSAVASNYKTIEIRTTLSPPIRLNVADYVNNQPPSAFTKFLQPTVILTDSTGHQTVVAPYGVAQNGSALPGLMLLGAFFGTAFLLGRRSVKK